MNKLSEQWVSMLNTATADHITVPVWVGQVAGRMEGRGLGPWVGRRRRNALGESSVVPGWLSGSLGMEALLGHPGLAKQGRPASCWARWEQWGGINGSGGEGREHCTMHWFVLLLQSGGCSQWRLSRAQAASGWVKCEGCGRWQG